MSAWNNLERRLGPLAIPGIIRYFVAFSAAAYVIFLANAAFPAAILLSGPLILHGEIWRLVTWPFVPASISFFGMQIPLMVQVVLMVFVLQCLWTFGELVESGWGAFRLNAYLLVGAIGNVAAALLFQMTDTAFSAYLTTSILFAVAAVAPDFQLLIYFLLPVKVKWLAWIALAFLLLQWAVGPWQIKAALPLCFANSLIFLGPWLARATRQSRDIAARRSRFQRAQIPDSDSLHRCSACGRTENTHPDLDFRVAADGHEYCTDHLPSRVKS